MNIKLDWQITDRLTPEDMNRIIANINELLVKSKLNISSINLAYTKQSLLFAEDFLLIEQTLEDCRNRLFTPKEWITSRLNWLTISSISFIDLNRIENNTYWLNFYLDQLDDNYKYCGTFYCGEEEGGII